LSIDDRPETRSEAVSKGGKNVEKNCKNYKNCPIYSGILKGRTFTTAAYRKQFCEAGEEGWKKCKRFLVKERTGKCPPDLLPNATQNVEQIVSTM
jgi:hypothetical protein